MESVKYLTNKNIKTLPDLQTKMFERAIKNFALRWSVLKRMSTGGTVNGSMLVVARWLSRSNYIIRTTPHKEHAI